MKKTLIASLIFGAFFLSISSSYAASCLVGDVTIGINKTAATACQGPISDNDDVSKITDIFGYALAASETWVVAEKSDENNSNLVANTATGTWEYTGDPLSSPFVIVLKASDSFAAYLFKDLGNLVTNSTGGFSISWSNGGSQIPNLSHMTIYSTTNTSAVPLPAALWLFGPALLGFMGFRRKNQS